MLRFEMSDKMLRGEAIPHLHYDPDRFARGGTAAPSLARVSVPRCENSQSLLSVCQNVWRGIVMVPIAFAHADR